MKRAWITVGTRTASVAVLLAGLVGGIHLGQQHQTPAPAALTQLAVSDVQLLKSRQNQHIADRAMRHQAEGVAAKKAATRTKRAATEARTVETKRIAKKKAEAAANAGPVEFTGPIPSSCKEFSGSRSIGCTLMLNAGFGIAEFPCLNQLWKKESGWNYKAENRSSGAYGIPQALPGSKMASAGSDWRTNPATQIKWGLGYIKGRYDTPCGAWSFFQSRGHY
ncbi:lytic transglycosylase domain-containing protein [Actinoplanes sp. DH11]|uniref:lytic transglycosylase domain-containing protein n=1 Tax=Actinoplanes sp. DH11 TaxID=2857011 RepID=UPI001E37D242|nr:lytic transglycosylase domain-containing protein [Actinoplanes sp. DH11]